MVASTPSKPTVDREEVLRLRKEGMTQEKVAETLGCSRAYVRSVINEAKGQHEGVALYHVTPIDVSLLLDNPWQIRSPITDDSVKGLADDIYKVGLLQHPQARPSLKHPGFFELAFGHRRVMAWRRLVRENKQRPEIFVQVDHLMNDRTMALIAASENWEREDVPLITQYAAWKRNLDDIEGLTIQDMAESMHLDRSTVSNNLRLLQLPKVVLDRVDSGEMSPRAAREFLCLVSKDHMHELEMENVIEEIAGTSGWRGSPDWRNGNIRRLIKESVTRSNVASWRRLDSLKSNNVWFDYGSSHRTPPSFDVEAFKVDYPSKIHSIPWDEAKEKSLDYTCEVKEWRKRHDLTKGETTGQAVPTKSGDTNKTEILANDPVVKKLLSVSTETGKAPNIKKLTPEHLKALGTRATVVSEDHRHSGSGFFKGLNGDYSGARAPFYLENIKECMNECTKGAIHVKSWAKPYMACTNEECYRTKLKAGRDKVAEKVEIEKTRIMNEDRELTEVLKTVQVPLALMLTQIVDIADNHDLLSRLYPVGRERHGAQDFAYLPECAELVMSVLKVSTKGKDFWRVKEDVMHKLAKASAETIPTIWVNLTVWVARQQGPEEVKRLAEALRLA